MTEDKKLYLMGWLKSCKDEIVPPLCVEIFLADGRNFYLHSVISWEDDDSTVVLRVWDLRELEAADYKDLKIAMDKVQDRNDYSNAKAIYAKLDCGNLRVPKDYISYVVEWHDKLWEKSGLGFKPNP